MIQSSKKIKKLFNSKKILISLLLILLLILAYLVFQNSNIVICTSRIDLSNKKIKRIPDQVVTCPTLKELILKNNDLDIRTISDQICSLNNLEYLDISGIYPPEFYKTDSNEEVSNQIPACIKNLSKLNQLYADGSVIKVIPPEIGYLKNLEILSLDSNQIKIIPSEIGQLSKLKKLILSRNKIETVPDDIENLFNLTELNLWGNNITDINPKLGKLIKLNSLNLCSNNISNLPDELWNLINLEELSLCYNNFSYIPDKISNLKAIKKLFIYCNYKLSEDSYKRVTNYFPNLKITMDCPMGIM